MNETLNRAYELLKKELIGWFDVAVTMIPSILLACVFAVVFWLLSRAVKNVVDRLVSHTSVNKTMRSLLTRTITIFVLAIGMFLILGVLGLQKTVTSLLAGAGVIGLVLGLAFQDFMSNFFASILISVRRPFDEGDVILTNDHMGTVVNVNLRNTVIKNFEGQQILVPNRLVVEKVLQNYTRYGTRRVTIPVGVAYETDLKVAAKTAIDSLSSLEEVLETPAPVVQFEKFADSSINFNLRFWIKYPGVDFNDIQSKAVMAVKAAFEENKIVIPFPTQTVDMSRLQKHLPETMPKQS